MVLWVIASYNVVVGYQCSRGLCCLYLQQHGALEHWYPTTTLHGTTTKKTMYSVFNTVKSSNLASI
jgi:hypothetical protein